MRNLYHRDEGPDGPLNTRQGQADYTTGRGQLSDRVDAAVAAAVAERGAFVTAEEIADIRLRERAKVRNTVPFFDSPSARRSRSRLPMPRTSRLRSRPATPWI